MRVAGITWSSILISSLCYGSQYEIDVLPACVKAAIVDARKNCSSLVIVPVIQMMRKAEIDNYNASLLAMVSGSCNSDLIITLNDRYYLLRPSGLLSNYELHPMQCTDEQCEVIIRYMYSILDAYNIPYDDARKKAEQESLRRLKLAYNGYVDSHSERTKLQQYMNYIGIMTLKSIIIGIPVGIIGIICYRWYEMNNIMNSEYKQISKE